MNNKKGNIISSKLLNLKYKNVYKFQDKNNTLKYLISLNKN